MASAVVYQPTSSKTLNEENRKKILPDKRFLRNVMPTSEAVVKLLDGVDGVVINQKLEVVETAMGMLSLGCCKVHRRNNVI